jgi:ubiquitin carboxyl-terminal hydrolase 9/13
MQTLPLLETKDNSASYGMSESLFTSLKDIFESVVASQSKVGVIRPHHFLEVLRREHEMFRTAMHQDAHEFLNLLLNEVVSNVESESARLIDQQKVITSAENEDSTTQTTATESTVTASADSTGSKSPNTTRWVHELFEGTLTSETQCLTCENVSQRDEVFLDLSVDLEEHSSVTSCLRKFSAEEMLCEKNKFHCDNCGGLQEAEKRMKIKRLPRVLALHLKRFKYTEDLQRLQKLFHRVVFPYHLRLFNTTDEAEDPDRLYELYAVVVHIGGGPYHGHYVTIIKTEDRGWLLFDDEMVEPVDRSFVKNFFGDRPGLACAYVLFYQETTLEAVRREFEQEGMTPSVNADLNLVNGMAMSSALNQIHTIQGPLEEEAHPFVPLNPIATAPQLSTHPENAFLTSLPQQTSAVVHNPAPPLSPKKSDLHSRKERAKEEKERKAAEKAQKAAEKAAQKEREKEDRVKRLELIAKRREDAEREQAELKAALEASKASKAEEDRRNGPAAKEPIVGIDAEKSRDTATPAHKMSFSGGLGRFRRGSRSISQRLALNPNSKERRVASSEFPRTSTSVEDTEPPQKNGLHDGEAPSKSTVISQSMPENGNGFHDMPPLPKVEKTRRPTFKGFGLRKKSYIKLST